MERSDEEQDQVEKEEAAFEIFIPCRLMAECGRPDGTWEGKKGGGREGGGESFLVSGRRAALCRAVARERPEYILEGGHKRPLQ